MHTHPNLLQINMLKKQLSDMIIAKNCDLLDSEIITLSQQLDQLVLPIFEQQLDVQKNLISLKSNYYFK